MFPHSFSTLIVFANNAVIICSYYSVVQLEIIKLNSKTSCILNCFCRMFPDIFDYTSVERICVDTSYACTRDACRRVRPRMCVPSFQVHPGTPPVGGGVTGNRYPSSSSLNYYYHSPTGKKREMIASNIFITIKILLR